MTILTLRPVPNRPTVFDAMLDGERIVRSRQPFYDGARELMKRGHVACEMLEARHEGSPIVAMRCLLGWAARKRVEERERGGMTLREYRPFDRAALSARVDQIGVNGDGDDGEVTEDAA